MGSNQQLSMTLETIDGFRYISPFLNEIIFLFVWDFFSHGLIETVFSNDSMPEFSVIKKKFIWPHANILLRVYSFTTWLYLVISPLTVHYIL